jgi:hypothetical protein
MPFRKLFWLLVGLTLVFIVLQATGYWVLEILVSLILLDIVLIQIIHQEENEDFINSLKSDIGNRLENIERLIKNILNHFGSVATVEHVYHIVEERLEEYDACAKERLKDELDRIAAKIIEVENKLYELRKNSELMQKRIETVEKIVFEEEEI